MADDTMQRATVAGAGRPRSVALSVLVMLDAALGLDVEQWTRTRRRRAAGRRTPSASHVRVRTPTARAI